LLPRRSSGGLGATFLSGATQAWISDEIGEAAAGAAFRRAWQVRQICTLLAVPVSVALASVHLNVSILVGASLMLVLGAYLAVALPAVDRAHSGRL
jgi:MFS transporter, DHA3 family, tetracycline resistance protein